MPEELKLVNKEGDTIILTKLQYLELKEELEDMGVDINNEYTIVNEKN